jgi:hypothetical protein
MDVPRPLTSGSCADLVWNSTYRRLDRCLRAVYGPISALRDTDATTLLAKAGILSGSVLRKEASPHDHLNPATPLRYRASRPRRYKEPAQTAIGPQAQGLPSPPTLPPILPQSSWSPLPSSPSPSSHLRSSRSRPARSASLRAVLSARASRSTASRT